jgi:hypothetical protein
MGFLIFCTPGFYCVAEVPTLILNLGVIAHLDKLEIEMSD